MTSLDRVYVGGLERGRGEVGKKLGVRELKEGGGREKEEEERGGGRGEEGEGSE